jgi:hypothetical protein
LSHELFYAYLHAAEARLARAAETRFLEAVEAVRTGYVIANSKKANREWQRHRAKASKRQVGLTGKALETAMSGLLLTHPEFLKGVPRPRNLQPRSLWSAQAKKGKG